MKNVGITAILLLLFNVNANSQTIEQQYFNTYNICIDVGTFFIANFASVNFEYNLVKKNENTKFMLRAGLSKGLIAKLFTDGSYNGVQLGFTYFNGKGSNFFEIGGGAVFFKNKNDSFTYPVFEVGYRYQDPIIGIIFKAKMGTMGLGIGFGLPFYRKKILVEGKTL